MTSPHPADWWLQRAFVYVGRIHPDKGVATIVGAWRVLRSSCGDGCPPLWVVGGTPEEVEALRGSIPNPEALVRDERAGRIHWWGYLDPAGVSTVLLRALALVVHSRYEPGGRVVLEAMTEGVPVIATPHGFAATLVRDWCTGFLVEFGNKETLAQRMEHFVRQPLLRNALGGAARAAAAAALGAWNFLDTHLEVYRAAIASTAPATGRPAIPPLPCLFPRFAPTYPYSHRPPSNTEVAAFVERWVGATAALHPGPESRHSVTWRTEAGSGEWIVKWPAPVLRQRPLWDEDGGPPALAHPARWASGTFASTLPFHLPLSGQDAGAGLHLFRSVPPAPLDWRDPESAARVAVLLRGTRSQVYPEAGMLDEVFGRSWRDASNQALREATAHQRRVVAESGRPWYPWSHVSLRHAWVFRARDIASGRLRLPPEWMLAAGRAAGMFMELAEAEAALPMGPCHGGLRIDRVRGAEDRLWLIGGDRAHLAYVGADLASLVGEASAYTAEGPEARSAYWAAALRLVAKREEERVAIVGWAALAALEGMARNHVMRRAELFAVHVAAWTTAIGLAEDAGGAVSRLP